MLRRPRRYTAQIQWNATKGWYAGYIPGIDGTDTWGNSMEELKAKLADTLARRLKEVEHARARSAPKRRPGTRRIDLVA